MKMQLGLGLLRVYDYWQVLWIDQHVKFGQTSITFSRFALSKKQQAATLCKLEWFLVLDSWIGHKCGCCGHCSSCYLLSLSVQPVIFWIPLFYKANSKWSLFIKNCHQPNGLDMLKLNIKKVAWKDRTNYRTHTSIRKYRTHYSWIWCQTSRLAKVILGLLWTKVALSLPVLVGKASKPIWVFHGLCIWWRNLRAICSLDIAVTNYLQGMCFWYRILSLHFMFFFGMWDGSPIVLQMFLPSKEFLELLPCTKRQINFLCRLQGWWYFFYASFEWVVSQTNCRLVCPPCTLHTSYSVDIVLVVWT